MAIKQNILIVDLQFTELNRQIEELKAAGTSEKSIGAFIKFKNNKIREAVRNQNERTGRRNERT